MGANEVLIICILSTIGVFLYAIGIFMLCGKGGILVLKPKGRKNITKR